MPQLLLNGLVDGTSYALVALGFTLVFRATHVVNLTQGEFVMLGGLLMASLYGAFGWPLWVALLTTILAAGLVGFLLYWMCVRPYQRRGASLLHIIIATVGVAFVVEIAAMALWGKDPVAVPPFSGGGPIKVGGVVIMPQMLWAVGAMGVLLLLLVLADRTLWGKAIRACATDAEVAQLVAINPRATIAVVFVVSGVLGAAAGAVVSPITYTGWNVGLPYSIKGFTAAILGGIDQPTGAVLGGILLGILESLAVTFWSAGYRPLVVLGLLLLILYLRPTGILGFAGVGRRGV